MQIYFSPFSPYVRKCLITADALALPVTLLPSNAHPVDRSQELIAVNPLGKVPTFVTDDGQVLYDSRVICEYLNARAQGPLFPQDASRWEVLTLAALADGMLDALLLARYETAARPEALQWPAWREGQLDKVATSLRHLEQTPNALPSQLHIGSISLACALWYLDLRFPDYAWRDAYPQVAAWQAGFGSQPLFTQTWSL